MRGIGPELVPSVVHVARAGGVSADAGAPSAASMIPANNLPPIPVILSLLYSVLTVRNSPRLSTTTLPSLMTTTGFRKFQ